MTIADVPAGQPANTAGKNGQAISMRNGRDGFNSVITAPGKGRNEIAAPLAPLDPLGTASRQDKLVSLADVKPGKVRWLFPNLIPLGSITVLDGAKGEGKSALANDLAARLTAGELMPLCNGEPVSGGAILLQAEDDLGATVKASIEAAGGDPGRIRVYTQAEPLYLDSQEDLAIIRQAAEEIDARLLVADPFSEFFTKSLKDEKTIRISFRRLRKLAEDLRMAVILIRHFTKSGTSALYRGLGGVAVANVARSALVVGHDPSSEDPYRHVLALNRCNLPRNRDVSLIYRTVKRGDAIVVDWLGESKYSADDLVSAARSPDDRSQLEEACYVLYSILATNEGSMPATEVYEAAKDGLVTIGTLKRAKKMLRVRSRRKTVRIGNDGKPITDDKPATDAKPATDGKAAEDSKARTFVQWIWQLPDDEDLLRPYKERLAREQTEDNTESVQAEKEKGQGPLADGAAGTGDDNQPPTPVA